ncbi:glycoside hydrolase family 3 C-terminal domain-containing protein [Solirubrobacter soli]|uniref:glycoside hydrolase family 3 C-terminal domain-containing protein n=1 Tax=Solirubrobacter soli TaxID=363832 RepID=UPI00146D5AAE|nr:glycoside hydrolase family 3 C-terminal domain-containing protein [Solirubrobacter soli]
MRTGLAPQQRAALLVAQMTLDEKIAMVHGAGYPLPLNAAGFAGVVPANTRLGIPALYLADSPVGVGNGSTGVTQWADTSALASTWDTGLASAYGSAYGAEQAGKGHNIALMPTVNILRLPLWGRAPETFSEDPYLTGSQAAAEIEGAQSQHVIATVKHFVANNQEVLRSHINVVAGQRALHEIYDPAFKMAVQDAGVGAVMCSYNRINGTYACENGQELTDALRDAWGFDGLVMSDWGAVHSTVKSARAGLDLEMPGVSSETNPNFIDQIWPSFFASKLKTAVLNGSVSQATLDGMVTHILTAMFRIGLFDHPLPNPATVKDAVVSTPAHLALSTKIAADGTVLLKNANSLLPLSTRSVRSIAVIGDAASENPQTAAGGSAAVLPLQTIVTPLAGITARAGGGVQVTHARGTLGVAGPLPAVPASAFDSGLAVTYYASSDLSGPPLATGTVPNLDYTGVPAAVAGQAVWSGRYSGTLTAPATGDYRFSLSGGGFVSVWIDGTPVVNYAPFHEPVANGLIHLGAGAHSIRVEITPFQGTLVTVDAFAITPGLHLGWQPQEDLMIAQAATAAHAADVAVVVVSAPASEGMDRSTLALPADQDKLISAVAGANPRTVVVLNTSSAVTMPWLNQVGAVVEAWYPGQTSGTALAQVLFGDVNPSGKLPVTFPTSDSQRPALPTVEYPGDGDDVYYAEGILIGYRWYDAMAQQPLFPFGYGLSYTTFRFSHLNVNEHKDQLKATVTVTNTGQRAGAEVVQLYVQSPASAKEPPRQLKAYTKVSLAAGESRKVNLDVGLESLAAWDNPDSGFVLHDGTYRIYVGNSSRSLPASDDVRIH